MPKITTIKDYLSQEELHERYRQADKVAERTHWHIIWLLSSGKRVKEVSQITDYTECWIRELVRRYNQTGPSGLDDRRRHITGATPLLSPNLQSELDLLLQQPPPDGGFWNGPKVAEWLGTKLGRKVHRQRGWDALGRLNYTLQQPRPHNAKADVEVGEQFKKN